MAQSAVAANIMIQGKRRSGMAGPPMTVLQVA
jgi:hypothetical protein